MSQWWVVGPVVLIAVVYVCRSLLPRAWRWKSSSAAGSNGCHNCAASGPVPGDSAVRAPKR